MKNTRKSGTILNLEVLSVYKFWPNTSISPRIILVPIVPDLYIWLIGRISGKAIGDLRAIMDNHLGSSGKVWRNCLSPTRVETEKVIGYTFFNMFKNSSRPKPLGPRSSWSSEGPLKVFLSRLPSRAFCTLWSSLLPSGAFVYPPQLSQPVIVRKVSKGIDIS